MLLLTSKVATSDNWHKSSHWEGPHPHSCYNAVESTKRISDRIITTVYEKEGCISATDLPDNCQFWIQRCQASCR
jgi:hypothetical protein